MEKGRGVQRLDVEGRKERKGRGMDGLSNALRVQLKARPRVCGCEIWGVMGCGSGDWGQGGVDLERWRDGEMKGREDLRFGNRSRGF